MTLPSPGDAEPLFAWVVRETSVDSTGTWETTPQRQLVVNIDAYLQVLDRVGAKVAGLLLTLSALSVMDPETGQRFIQASQERLGGLVSGGDGGWTEHPTRQALKVLISAGFLRKEEGRALGRSRGSEAPKWYLTSALFDPTCSPIAPAEMATRNEAPSKLDASSDRPRKNHDPSRTWEPSRRSAPKLRTVKAEAPHVMDGNTHLHHMNNDDNDGLADLLSLAVIQELGSLGWDRPEQSVRRFGAFPLGAWLTASRHTRRNPGGFIRTQTAKPNWPHFPENWDPETTTLIVDSSGRVQAVPRSEPTPSPTGTRLSVPQIHEILEEAGELGAEVRRAWLSAADDGPRPISPEERSKRLQEAGAALLSRYGLLPRAEADTA